MAELLNGKFGERQSVICDVTLSGLIFLNLVAVCLESVESIYSVYKTQLLVFEIISVAIFTVEYILRIWSAPERTDLKEITPLRKRLAYITSFTGLVDAIAIIPSLLQFLGFDLRWLRVLRMVRLLKISHYSSALEDLASAIFAERRAFGASLYILAIATFLSSALIYIAEHDVQPENFSSIPGTMWWSIITLTTVGYGDVSPVTGLGKVVGAITALMGVCTVALLTGVVASAFSNQLARRKAIFEAEIGEALADGIITEEENEKIENLREQFNLTEEHALAIIETMKEQRKKS